MKYYDIFLISILIIYIILLVLNFIYFRKYNETNEILEKNKIIKSEMNDLLRNKLPLVITGEIEDWFIFNNKDKIDKNKLTKKILKENSYKLFYPLSISKKMNIFDLEKNKNINFIKEKNTRHFIGILTGKISIYLINPNEKNNFKNNGKVSKYNIYENSKNFNKIKYNEIILDNEKLLYIPYNWWYCYNVLKKTKMIDINSESLITLPIKMINDKL